VQFLQNTGLEKLTWTPTLAFVFVMVVEVDELDDDEEDIPGCSSIEVCLISSVGIGFMVVIAFKEEFDL
jgi:hypothetical protein